ncbi:hypothetical protein QJS04_geneDACA004231 [Acorus gramineus]|uniref:RRM domain-containing protein n=1 Tax=Acorus gramineus TaxID=55184 RepID=A0AAV9B6X2_ACOGR|nr:hypothetical protein QJS04_geneDACA004231 [Acorus gramineus]
MDPLGEEQLDYGDEEYGGSQKLHYQGSGTISTLAEDDMMGEDDEYDDLYQDVNVGEGFIQTLQQQQQQQQQRGSVADPPVPLGAGVGNGGPGPGPPKHGLQDMNTKIEVDQHRTGGGYMHGPGMAPPRAPLAPQLGNPGYQGGPTPPLPPAQMQGNFASGPSSVPMNQPGPILNRPPMMVNENVRPPPPQAVIENGPTMLFVGELHWWTTDAELEAACSRFGRVKEIKFYDERASGKSKGYCQVEFYDGVAAAACKEGMNGHAFNGRSCVVAFASPQTLRQMGAAYMNKNQMQAQPQGRRMMNDGAGRGGGDGGRNFGGKVGWGGRGGPGMMNRGQGGGVGQIRGRGPMGPKGMVGNAGGVVGGVAGGGGAYGQGLGGAGMGGPAGGMMHPQGMMGVGGFDPTYMGRGGGYAGFSGPVYPGMMPSFPGVSTVALPGVAPHVNPAFFGRGMPANGMGMMGSGGMDGHPAAGMWTDTSMGGGGWSGEEHGRRTRESSYGGDDGASEYGYAEASHERGGGGGGGGGGRPNSSREKERAPERDWSGNSERRHRDEREPDWDRSDRDRHREEKDGYRDHHRQRERGWDHEDDYDRGQSSSRSRSKSRVAQEEDHRSRSRDADYGKRRRSD